MRFAITHNPTLAPGQCKACGGCKTPMLDMLHTEESYGAVYYCLECIQDMVLTFTKSNIPVEKPIITPSYEDVKIKTELLKIASENVQKAYDVYYSNLNSSQFSIFDIKPVDNVVQIASDVNNVFDNVNNPSKSADGSSDVQNLGAVSANSKSKSKFPSI
jgi:hypothetical protein